MKKIITYASLIAGTLLTFNTGAAPAAPAAGAAHGRAVHVAPVGPEPEPITGTPTTSGNQPAQANPTGQANQTSPANQPGVPPNATVSTTTQTTSQNPTGTANNNSQATSGTSANGNVGNGALPRGQAVTATDRTLLTTLNQGLATQMGVSSLNAVPVHFFINNGAVTLAGSVPTADESQRILARVKQTPGVVSVFNDLRVGAASSVATQSPQTGMFATPTDHAFSPADQSLLTAVQQQAGKQFGINGASTAQLPVHFSIQNGVVGISGQVSTFQEKQTLIASLQSLPGVTRVVDNVGISAGAAGNASTPTTGAVNPALNENSVNKNFPPTSRDPNQPNTVFRTNNNSSGL